MKKIKVINSTTYAVKYLNGASEYKVHSVYRNTINIMCGQHLIALQGANTPLSPISLQIELAGDNLTMPNLREGQWLNNHIFDLQEAVIFDTKLQSLNKPLPVDILFSALQLSQANSFDYPLVDIVLNIQSDNNFSDLDLIFSFIDKKLRTALAKHRAGSYLQAAKSLASIIGAGIGLTPSGDDFLCGVLAGFTLMKKTHSAFCTALCTEIKNNLHRTNDISAAFLRAAIDGHFSQYICNIKPTSTAEQLTAAFGKVGHSSGFDTLCGLYFTQVLYPCGNACSYPYSSCRSRTPVQ